MKITIEINTENGAFQESYVDEVEQVINQAYRAVVLWNEQSVMLDVEAVLFDSNGSRCGFVRGEFE